MNRSDRDPDAIDRIRDDATEQKPTLHNKIMNIPVVLRDMLKTTAATDLDSVQVYKRGHRDARHAAAEIANEADARIRELEAQLAAKCAAMEADFEEERQMAERLRAQLADARMQLAAATERERKLMNIITGIVVPLEIDGRFVATVLAIREQLAALAAAQEQPR